MAAASGKLDDIAEGAAFDVVVLGAGAGGMAAAVFAALEGRSVLLVERTEYLGGTSSLSAATTWVPGTRLAATVGATDSREAVSGFLDRAVGNRAPKALREAFLDAGPEAIHTLLDRTEVQFRARPFHPDYLYELEGSTSCGRALEPEPFDGRALGPDLALIRPPIPEFTILGGMAIDRDDIRPLLKMKQSPGSFAYSARLIARYGLARLRYPRDPRLAGTRNPTLGPVGAAPFYAVRLFPGDIGAAMGLVIADTAARLNAFAATGVDTDFHRGETVYEKANGDAEASPGAASGVG
jgi:FAD binding domain